MVSSKVKQAACKMTTHRSPTITLIRKLFLLPTNQMKSWYNLALFNSNNSNLNHFFTDCQRDWMYDIVNKEKSILKSLVDSSWYYWREIHSKNFKEKSRSGTDRNKVKSHELTNNYMLNIRRCRLWIAHEYIPWCQELADASSLYIFSSFRRRNIQF